MLNILSAVSCSLRRFLRRVTAGRIHAVASLYAEKHSQYEDLKAGRCTGTIGSGGAPGTKRTVGNLLRLQAQQLMCKLSEGFSSQIRSKMSRVLRFLLVAVARIPKYSLATCLGCPKP